jgi:exodeoxyribonuclease VII small subunit
MSEQPTNPAQSYAANYNTLKQIAERLRSPDEIDIDELVPLVNRATAAYQLCRERLEKVRSALAELEAPAEAATSARPHLVDAPPADPGVPDDSDIPF